MQYSFSYMYFLMQEPKPFDLDEFWDILDTNKDGYAATCAVRVLTALSTDRREHTARRAWDDAFAGGAGQGAVQQ